MAGTDTIFALSTGRTPSGVAIIRVSGPSARDALRQLFGRVPPPRKAALGDFVNPSGVIIDRGLALYFPAPGSFTGEDCAEFQCHGGPAVVAAILSALGEMDGLRVSEAGEFTHRAFLNGKLDLAGVEGLSDLIAAETETQRRFALETSQGRQSSLYLSWRTRIAEARARLEADLDFPDEEDVPDDLPDKLLTDLGAIVCEIEAHCAGYRCAEIIRDGFRVVIAGAPNAGKSSLLNQLAGREVAIVSRIPGTTRDVLEVAVDLGGDKVIFMDTAGLRETDDEVEGIGVERAKERIRAADLVLYLVDLGEPSEVEVPGSECPIWTVGSKQDLLGALEPITTGFRQTISAKTGAGIEVLLEAIRSEVRKSVSAREGLLPARMRHVRHLTACSEAIRRSTAEAGMANELRSEHLRIASDELGRIVGVVDADELLGIIFSSFCIGK